MPGFDLSIPVGHWVDTEHQARLWMQRFRRTYLDNGGLGLDTETSGVDKLRDRIIVWSMSDGVDRICMPAQFIPIFKEPLLENENVDLDFTRAKFDAHMFANSGIDLTKAGQWRSTDVQSFLVNENNQGRHGLKECITDHFGRVTPTFEQTFGKVPPKKIDKLTGRNLSKTTADLINEAFADPTKRLSAADYASLDSFNSTFLRKYFDGMLGNIRIHRGYSLADYYYAIEVPFTKLLFKLERRGITVDRGYLHEKQGPIEQRMTEITWQFNRAAGRELNLDSNHDTRWFFIEFLRKTPIKMTKGGKSGNKQAAVDEDVLDQWSGEGDPWAQLMMEYRKLSKIHGTYIVGLDKWVDLAFRIHTSLNQTGAVTMRLSSSDPNLQNIPRPSEDKFRIRDAFIPGEGMILIVADYAQLEMRLMAHFSRDQKMIEAIRNGVDLHCLTVSEMYGIAYDEVMGAVKHEKDLKKGKTEVPLTARQEELLFYRQAAKATGFGIIYGIGGPHLAANLTKELKRLVTPEEGIQLIRKWYNVFPGVRKYIEDTKSYLLTKGFVQTIVGRYRRFGDIRGMSKQDGARAERQAVNSIIQGTASDIAKRAMLNIDEDPEMNQLGYKMLLQIHDEIIGECPNNEQTIAAVKKRKQFLMENPFHEALLVPLPAEVGSGFTWSTAK